MRRAELALLVAAALLLVALGAGRTTAAPNVATPASARPAAVADAPRDDRGRPVAPGRAPLRIVSLVPSLTEGVCALGDCARLVGVDRYSDWPPAVKALPQLGGLDDPQIERIVALHPDLVLASRSARAVERLEDLGLTVVALEANSLDDTRRVLQVLSAALARPGDGEALWQRIDAQIVGAAARVPPAWRGRRVYFEIASTPYAAGEGSFIGQTLARLGLANIVPAALGPFPQVNPEFIVRAQPDLVMSDAGAAAEMTRRPGWQTLLALQQRRQCGFAAPVFDVLVRPGPRLGEAAERLADCIAGLGAPG